MALINGVEHGFSTIVITIAGVPFTGVTEINYSDTQNITNNYGTGNKPISRTFAEIEFAASITLHLSTLQSIINAAPNGRIQEIPLFGIGITFVPNAQTGAIIPISHNLLQCSFMGIDISTSQGDTLVSPSIPILPGDITLRA